MATISMITPLLDLEVSSAGKDYCSSQNHHRKHRVLLLFHACCHFGSHYKDGLHLNDVVSHLCLEDSPQDQRLFAAVCNGVKVSVLSTSI